MNDWRPDGLHKNGKKNHDYYLLAGVVALRALDVRSILCKGHHLQILNAPEVVKKCSSTVVDK